MIAWGIALLIFWVTCGVMGYGYCKYCWLDYLARHPELGRFGMTHLFRCLFVSLLGPAWIFLAIKKRLEEGVRIRFCYKEKSPD